MRKRKLGHELMDEADPADAQACLANLVEINRELGGHAIVRKMLAWAGCDRQPFTLLDVGAASGDSARVISGLYPSATVVSLDQNAVNLRAAPPPKVLADAFQLPFPPRSFDYVFSSLFLHHFSDYQIVFLLRHFGEVARRGVLISDLERHPIPYYFLPASSWFYKWHWMAVHDGKLSVRAALTADELRELAIRAGLTDVEVRVHRPAFRLSLVAGPLSKTT